MRAPFRSHARVVRTFLLPLAVVGVTTWLKLAIGAPLGQDAPFFAYALAFLVCGWLGGGEAAIVATILGTLAVWYFFIPVVRGSVVLGGPAAVLQLVGFIAEGAGIAAIVHAFERAKREVIESNAKKSAIIETALDAIILMGEDGRIEEFNPAAETIFGHSRSQAIGRQLAELIIPERYRPQHARGLAHHVATGEGPILEKRLELSALHASGSEFPVELIVTASRMSDRSLYAGWVRDISDRRKAETERAGILERERAARGRVERIQKLTAALAVANTSREIAGAIVNLGVDALGAQTGALVWPIDEKRCVIAAHRGVPESTLRNFEVLPLESETPALRALRTRAPEWIASAEEFDAHYPVFREKVQGAASGAAASLPLIARDRVLGGVSFRFASERTFTEDDRATMLAMAALTAEALDRARLFDREVMARNRLETLGALSSRLARTLDSTEIGEVVTHLARYATGAGVCTLYRVDDHAEALELVAERRSTEMIAGRIERIPLTSSDPAAATLRTGESLFVETLEEYDRLYPDRAAAAGSAPRTKSFAYVPMIIEGDRIGLLGLGFFEEKRFDLEEREFAQTLTSESAQAVRRAQRMDRESAARQSAERARVWLATTLRSIGDGVIATDAKGEVVLLNPVAEQMTGWSEVDARGQPLSSVFRIVDERTRGEIESPVTRVLRDGRVVGLSNHTILLKRTGSEETPINDSAAPIVDESGIVQGVVLVFRSVSEEDRARAQRTFLAESSATLAASLDYRTTLSRLAELVVPRIADWCAVHLLNPDTGGLETLAVAHVNPSRMQQARELEQRYPPDPKAVHGAGNVIRSGVSEIYPEIGDEAIAASAKDKEHAELLLALGVRSAIIVPIVSRAQPLGAITLCYAESSRRYRADELPFIEELARRAGAAIDNARLYDAAQKAIRLRDDFLSIAGHELRTPLTAQLLQLESIRAAFKSGNVVHAPSRWLERVDKTIAHTERLARLIGELLDVSRITSGRLELSLQYVDFGALAAEVIEQHRELARRKGSSIELESAGPVIGRWDPTRVEQILTNLLGNAIKYGNGNPITVDLSVDNNLARLTVSDNGIGIPVEAQSRVFERFERAVSDRNYGGLGLGLWIVRKLVEAHGGTVSLQSAVGGGTTFTVLLPLGPAEEPESGRSGGG